MYRRKQNFVEKNYDATKTASVDMIIGMGVVKGDTTVSFPTSTTATDIFFVGKETIPTGLDSLREMSDYDLQNIKAGEFVWLDKPLIGERYWTDQISGTIAKGDYVAVNNAGKFVKATTSTTPSNLKVTAINVKDTYSVNANLTHTGILIEVVDWKNS